MSTSQPDPGTIYQLDGHPIVYVRTEQRSGCSEPEHLFVKARDRAVFQLWTREIPSEAELVIDTEGRAEANEVRWLLEVEKHNNGVLLGLLRDACSWLPRERANELRRRYSEAQPTWEEA